MISQCCICKIVESIKCPKCPDGVVVQEVNDYVFKAEPSYQCPSGHVFTATEGGYTHGYCRPCLEERLAEVENRGVSKVLANYNHGVVVEECQ